jgi:hypothetical protein
MTYDQIIALLDEHDQQCPVRAIQAGGGFWSATVKELREYLKGGTIDPQTIESLEFFPPRD